MKILNHKYLCMSLLAACVTLFSCGSDDDYSAGPQMAADCPGLTFGSDYSLSEELDPSDETSKDITIYRVGDSSSAGTYNLTVRTNTDNVFSVPSTVSFSAGQTEATITVTFNSAEVGTTYELEIVLDEDDVDAYNSDTYMSYSYSVVRVKWNSLGTGQWLDNFWYGVYWDDIEIQQRDDNPSVYRFESPYTDEFIESWGDTPGTYQQYISFTLMSTGYVTWDDVFYFNVYYDYYGAEIKAYYPSSLSSSYASLDYENYAVFDDNGEILYFVICPYWWMDGIGGWYYYYCYLAFPGYDLAGAWGWQ